MLPNVTYCRSSTWAAKCVKPGPRDKARRMLRGLNRKATGLLLNGKKFFFQMNVKFVFHLESKVSGKSGESTEVMLLDVQFEVFTVMICAMLEIQSS